MNVRRSHKFKFPPVLKCLHSLFLKAIHTDFEKCKVQQKLACCMVMGINSAIRRLALYFVVMVTRDRTVIVFIKKNIHMLHLETVCSRLVLKFWPYYLGGVKF